ncbi:response regulator [Sulfurimonas aquatica]|uniref:Response regulator n=1 Tax=Sulfurimonas aquatica TaxID=2672570 RepID=A0A975GCK5_9BACT|nr:response regulator [Sulfurimonas aquatica]QSZ41408.1 response regulator [Sulfurimonas aquatica]
MQTNHNAVEILLVEDNPADARLTKEAMNDSKIANNLHIVEDGQEAMDFVRKLGKYSDAPTPDLVLLDLNLPKKDGREVLKEIKEDDNLKMIPVIVLTSSKAEEDIIKMYSLHANSYIQKPLDFEQFSKIVETIENFWFTIVKLPTKV